MPRLMGVEYLLEEQTPIARAHNRYRLILFLVAVTGEAELLHNIPYIGPVYTSKGSEF